jgi:hypothetical protein
MSPEDCRKAKALRAELQALWDKHRATKAGDPCAAERWLREIGLRQGRLAALMAGPDDPLDWWCVWCERVSVQPRPLVGFCRCRYPDCDPLRRSQELIARLFGPPKPGSSYRHYHGRSWFVIRRDLHPEYPEAAEPGRCYPVPEITPNMRMSEWRKPPESG